jgi:hypothetical protein
VHDPSKLDSSTHHHVVVAVAIEATRLAFRLTSAQEGSTHACKVPSPPQLGPDDPGVEGPGCCRGISGLVRTITEHTEPCKSLPGGPWLDLSSAINQLRAADARGGARRAVGG